MIYNSSGLCVCNENQNKNSSGFGVLTTKLFTLLFFISILIINACKKDNSTETGSQNNNAKKYNVNFKAELFGQSVGPFKSESAPHISDEPMPKLYTRIYNLDEGGVRVYEIKSLAPGNYVAVFVASNHPFSRLYGLGGTLENENPYIGGFNNIHFDTMLSQAAKTWSLNDIFYKKLFFTVSNKDINQTVLLDRIVAGLEVVIEDELPPAVANLELTVVNDAVIYHFKSDTRTTAACDKISNFQRTTNPLTAFVLGLGDKQIIIRALSNTGAILAEKRVSATFYTNKKTTLSGKLFTNLAAFAVTVNQVWDAPPATIPF